MILLAPRSGGCAGWVGLCRIRLSVSLTGQDRSRFGRNFAAFCRSDSQRVPAGGVLR